MTPFSRTQQIEKSGAPPAPAAVKAFLLAQRLKGESAQQRADYERSYAGKAAELLAHKKKQQEEFVRGVKARQAWVDRVAGKHREALEKMEKDVASKKLNPLKHWTKESPGGTLLGVLLSGLSGAASGLVGGENQFLKQVRLSMNASYEAQKDEIARKERGITRAANGLDALEKIHGDAETARLGQHVLELTALQTQMEGLAKEKEGTLQGVQMKENLAQLLMEKAAKIEEYNTRVYGQLTQQAVDKMSKPVVVGGGSGSSKPLYELPKEFSEKDQARLRAIQDREVQLGVHTMEGILRDLVQAARLPPDQHSRIGQFLKVGDTSKATELLAGILEKNPEAAARIDNAKAAIVKQRTGAGQTAAERAAVASFVGAWKGSKAARAALNVLADETNNLRAEAAKTDPKAWAQLQAAKRSFMQTAPKVGIGASEQAVGEE